MRIFVAHHPMDQALASELADRLRDTGHEPWLASEQTSPGENVFHAIGKALDRSEALVVLVSPEAMLSKDVMDLVAYALVTPRFAHHLYALKVRATPKESVPWIFERMVLIEGSRNVDAGMDTLIGLIGQKRRAKGA